MDDTNPQGSVKTVRDAAGAFLGMMEPTEPQGQPEAPQEPEYEAQAEYEDSPEEVEAGEEVQEEPQQTPKYRVKVDNDEVEVDVDELIKGYSRTSDYTRKTQQLAEQRKVIEAEKAKIDEASKLRDQYAQRLQVIEQVLAQSPQEDMAALKETDPIGYAVKMAEQVEREKQLAAVRQERAQLAQRQQAEQQARLQAQIVQEAERLRTAIPDLADEAKGEVVRKEIKDFARSIGFSEQELAQVYDHRAVVTLYKAMQYDKLQKSKPATAKRVAEAPKTLRPGTTQQSDPKQDVVKKLKGQLRKTGKQRDAAKLFERFL
jgi:hypothetical protein